MHGFEEVSNVLMIEMNKCIYVYIVFDWVVDESPKTEVEKLRMERLEVFLNVFAGFVNLGKSEKQRKLWPIFLKNLSV